MATYRAFGLNLGVHQFSRVRGESGELCHIWFQLRDAQGSPVPDVVVQFYDCVSPLYAANTPFQVTTDAAGMASLDLLWGRAMEVVFIGTSYIKRFTVPDLASANLFDVVSLVSPDIFDVDRSQPTPLIKVTV